MVNVIMDVDGVLRNFIETLQDTYRKYVDSNYEDVEVTEWGLHKFFPIGSDIYEFAFKDYHWEIFSQAVAYLGAKSMMDRLNAIEGVRVTIATSQTNTDAIIDTVNWLQDNGIAYDAFYCCLDEVKHVKGDILLDDKIENLNDFEGVSVCMARPWNKNYDGIRVNEYDQFVEMVKGLAYEQEN